MSCKVPNTLHATRLRVLLSSGFAESRWPFVDIFTGARSHAM